MPAPRLRRALLATGALAAGSAVAWAFLVEPGRLQVREVRVALPGLRAPRTALLVSDVDYPSMPRREEGVRRIARQVRPDVVLLAGDVLDRHRMARDPAAVRAAGAWAASLGRPVLAAPGEEESPARKEIAPAWAAQGVDLLANEARAVSLGGEEVDVFVSDLTLDAPPWGLGHEDGRPYAVQSGRSVHGFLVDGQARDWVGTDTRLAFRIGAPETYFDLHLGWTLGDGALPRRGLKVGRHGGRPAFRIALGEEIREGHEGRRSTGFVPRSRIWSRARIRIEPAGGRIRVAARFWEDGDPEPAEWLAEATFPAPPGGLRGVLAVGGRRGEKRIADLVVADLEGRVLSADRFDDERAFRERWSDTSRLGRWLRTRDPARPSILLTHNPDVVLDVLRAGGVPPGLVVAGHTHGGQIRLPLLGAVHTSTLLGRRYDAGLFRVEGIPLYITAGVGTSVIPARFLVPPEVAVLRLVPPEDR